ncbi:MAG: CNP1-like family protein [Pseudomonadota bacterium]
MKRPFFFLLALLPGLAPAVEYLNPDFVEDETPWEEMAASLPPYPKNENLIAFEVSSATSNKFMVDTASLSVGKDGVVRYTVVIESPRGARTVNYEGMRCDTGEYKIYGFGQADGSWTENKRAAWEPFKQRSLLSYHKALSEDYFCPDWIAIRDAEQGIRNLKRGPRESMFQ